METRHSEEEEERGRRTTITSLPISIILRRPRQRSKHESVDQKPRSRRESATTSCAVNLMSLFQLHPTHLPMSPTDLLAFVRHHILPSRASIVRAATQTHTLVVTCFDLCHAAAGAHACNRIRIRPRDITINCAHARVRTRSRGQVAIDPRDVCSWPCIWIATGPRASSRRSRCSWPWRRSQI
jgi:hypothetical protein